MAEINLWGSWGHKLGALSLSRGFPVVSISIQEALLNGDHFHHFLGFWLSVGVFDLDCLTWALVSYLAAVLIKQPAKNILSFLSCLLLIEFHSGFSSLFLGGGRIWFWALVPWSLQRHPRSVFRDLFHPGKKEEEGPAECVVHHIDWSGGI